MRNFDLPSLPNGNLYAFGLAYWWKWKLPKTFGCKSTKEGSGIFVNQMDP